MSDADDPQQWRSATDPKSGRTYWYHRVTRISTWVKPPYVDHQMCSSVEASVKDSPDRNPDNISWNRRTHEENYRSNGLSVEPWKDIPSSDIVESYSYKRAANGEDSPRNNISNIISCLTSSDESSRVDALLLLSSRCGVAVEVSVQLANSEFLLNNLAVIILRGSSNQCRRLALKILCSLAICEDTASAFQENQSWVTISQRFLHWEGDKESTLLFCIFICCLLERPTRNMISSETVESIGDLLGFMLDDYRKFPNSGMIDLNSLQLLTSRTSVSFCAEDWSFLYTLFSGAEHGRNVSSVLLLVILSSVIGAVSGVDDSHSESDDKSANNVDVAYNVLRTGGGASTLLGLSTSRRVTDEVRERSKELLLEGMSKSAYLRERILDNFYSMSVDHNSLPICGTGYATELVEQQYFQSDKNNLNYLNETGLGRRVIQRNTEIKTEMAVLKKLCNVTFRYRFFC